MKPPYSLDKKLAEREYAATFLGLESGGQAWLRVQTWPLGRAEDLVLRCQTVRIDPLFDLHPGDGLFSRGDIDVSAITVIGEYPKEPRP